MRHVVAVLETMWDWRGMTSGAGYREAPRYFRINEENYTGKRLYKLVGDSQLLVTNACRELVYHPSEHGRGDPVWLSENLKLLDDMRTIDVLLVCGRVAQQTYAMAIYRCVRAVVFEIPHPAARTFWTRAKIDEIARMVQIPV